MQDKNIMTDYTNMENRAPALATVDLLANEVKNIVSNGANNLREEKCAVVAVCDSDGITNYSIGDTRTLLRAYIEMIKQLARDDKSSQAKKILQIAASILQMEATKYD